MEKENLKSSKSRGQYHDLIVWHFVRSDFSFVLFFKFILAFHVECLKILNLTENRGGERCQSKVDCSTQAQRTLSLIQNNEQTLSEDSKKKTTLLAT